MCEQVRTNWPPFITVGEPFAVQLKASNSTQHVLDLGVRLGDTAGFMVAGKFIITGRRSGPPGFTMCLHDTGTLLLCCRSLTAWRHHENSPHAEDPNSTHLQDWLTSERVYTTTHGISHRRSGLQNVE